MAQSPTSTKDLTDLKSKQEKTIAQLENFKLLIDSVQDYAIFLLDPDGVITSWNKGAEKNKGYKADEIIGKHFSTFYLEQDKVAKKPERELELAKRFGRVEDEDWRVRKDGSQFWANVVITALFDQTTNELVGFAKVTRDLTERKHHEDELRNANELLKQQQRELEFLNKSKDEFISLASHQLRTPATSIKQYLGMILEGFIGKFEEDQLDVIKKAYDSNERQIATVNNLLKIAQMDAGQVSLRRVPTDIYKLLNSVIEEYDESFSKRNQTVTLDTDKNLAPVSVDVSYFRMAIENLIDNASKYTPDGGNITIIADVKDDYLLMSIKDNGVGIEAENLNKLFTKFSRIPNAMSDHVSGSGLGLYWVSRVIALHGGRIKVHSKVGEGTTFNIFIPAGGVGG